MILSPCKDCRNRVLGCHSSCEAYTEFRATHEKYKRKQQEQNEISQVIALNSVNRGKVKAHHRKIS